MAGYRVITDFLENYSKEKKKNEKGGIIGNSNELPVEENEIENDKIDEIIIGIVRDLFSTNQLTDKKLQERLKIIRGEQNGEN